MKVALVHDYLTQFGGAERVLKALMEIFPHAPVYTLLHDPRVTGKNLDHSRVRCSYLQKIPLARSRHRLFPVLMPLFAEGFDLSRYDVVISASHSFGKGVLTGPNTLHISYCFTPLRYVWDDSHRYIREFDMPGWFRAFVPFALTYVRLWDSLAAKRVDHFVAISDFVAKRIRKYYHREAPVLYPPVDCSSFNSGEGNSRRFLIVSRLVPYKRIDIAVEAFNKLGLPLDIVGAGPEEERLRAAAGPNVKLHGFLPEDKIREMYANCRAFIFPQEEDFGITPLEAAAAGKPVVAYAGGGALETVIENRTGIFFREQSSKSLVNAVKELNLKKFDSEAIRRHAWRFDTGNFKVNFMKMVNKAWEEFSRQRAIKNFNS